MYKAGDKVWVLVHQVAAVKYNIPQGWQAAEILGTATRGEGWWAVDSVAIGPPPASHSNWIAYERYIRPRDDDDTVPPSMDTDVKTTWDKCIWKPKVLTQPERISYESISRTGMLVRWFNSFRSSHAITSSNVATN
jgi:hypothetical protein